MPPKVSVVIPGYNHARYLRQRVNSVLLQSYQDFEVILMDDRSTDDSRLIISEYANDPRVRIELNDKNSGSTFAQWSKGVQLARGEYIWIAESDDYADEQLLDRLLSALDAEPQAGFGYCRSWRVNAQDELDGFGDFYLTDLDQHHWTADYSADGIEECRKYFSFRNAVPNASAVLFRKAAYLAAGGADQSFRMCGDWKLWASMALKGRVVYLAQPLNYFRFHNENVRGRDVRNALLASESLRVIAWMCDQLGLAPAQRRKIANTLPELWIPPVLTLQVPLAVRLKILRQARAIDSQALTRVLRPGLVALRMKLTKMLRSGDKREAQKL